MARQRIVGRAITPMVSEQARPTTCPNCEQVYDPGRTTYCDKCGERFPWAGPEPMPSGLMVARLLLGIGAAVLFSWVGYTLVTLQSFSQDGAAGVFYNMMGWFSFGMALVAFAVALPREQG
jgi:hypothetical protein